MARGRGGYQPPRKPAAASGPGALSQRTDRVPALQRSGLPYGDNKAINEQQASAPLNPQAQSGPGTPGPAPTGANFYDGTRRPGEPLTAGVDFGPGAGAQQPLLGEDPNAFLRALAERFPHPDLDRLLARVSRG